MKKRSKIVISILLALLTIGGIIYYIWYTNSYICKFTIYPTTTYPTYYFVIDKNNVLHCYTGRRQFDKNISSNGFLIETEYSAKRKLIDHEREDIIGLLNAIEENGNDYEVDDMLSSWNASLYYNGKIYTTNLSLVTNEKLKALSDKIRSIAPIHVDLNIIA